MQAQTIINKVYKTFIKDKNPRSVNAHGSCEYGKPGSVGCAVACVMPESVRKELRELELEVEKGYGSDVDSIIEETDILKNYAEHQELLSALQTWHDNEKLEKLYNDIKVQQFKGICYEHGLKYPGDK